MIRTSSARDVIAIKEETKLPVIGLIKIQYEGYDAFITPTMKEVDELVDAGSDIIALDCCQGERCGVKLNEFLENYFLFSFLMTVSISGNIVCLSGSLRSLFFLMLNHLIESDRFNQASFRRRRCANHTAQLSSNVSP